MPQPYTHNLSTAHVDNALPPETVKAADINGLATHINQLEVDANTGGPLDLPGHRVGADHDSRYARVDGIFNVKTYGAVGDGVADDTAAIQAAVDAACAVAVSSGYGGTISLPTGRYLTTSMLTLGRGDNAFVFLAFRGSPGAEIRYAGPTNATAIKLSRVKHFRIDNLVITNTGVAGTTIGLLLTNSTTGTGTNNGVVNNVQISGFDVDVQLGDAAGAASSEVTWLNLEVQNCRIGVLISSTGNTLNNSFHNFIAFNCTLAGIYNAQGGSVSVYGGASNGNYNDFYLGHAGTYNITGFRAESLTAEWLIASATTVFTGIVVSNCLVTGTSASDGVVIRMNGHGPLTLIGCSLQGKLSLNGNGYAASLEMIGCGILDTVPFTATTAGAGARLHYRVAGCWQTDATYVMVVPFDDEEGIARGATRTPLRRLTAPGGVGIDATLATQDFRALSGLSGTTTQAKNLRGSAAFASAATVAVVFGTAEVDATYFVTISGNVNETFWVTGKGTGGFTIHSSNAGSTASVDWLLVR